MSNLKDKVFRVDVLVLLKGLTYKVSQLQDYLFSCRFCFNQIIITAAAFGAGNETNLWSNSEDLVL